MLNTRQWAAILALTVGLTACGSAAPASSGASASGEATNIDQLYAAAKREGTVTVYAPTPTEIMSQMVSAFNQKYPGIKANATDLTAGQTVERIVTESASGKVSIDASQASLGTIQPLVERQLLAKVDWPKFTDGASGDLMTLDGQALVYYHLPNVMAYNTQLLKESDVPHQWEDLLKPQFKGGKMLIDARGNFAGFLGVIWDQDRLTKYATDIKAQQPLFIPRMVDGINRLAAGEAAVATVSMNNYVIFAAKKAPVGLTPISPVNASIFTIYALKNAPHPNAARLWVAWAASKEGRALFEKTGNYALATPGSGSNMEKLLSDAHLTIWAAKNFDEVAQEDKYQKMVQDIFGAVK